MLADIENLLLSRVDVCQRDDTLGDAHLGKPGCFAHGKRRTYGAGSGVVAGNVEQLRYDDVRLAELISDLNRYLPKAMSINDAQLADTRVSAVLYLEDQNAMLEALGKALPIRWKSVSDNLVIITRER